MAITLDGTSGITTPGITASSGDIAATTLSVDGNNINATNGINFRNRIINGDMRIDQRNAGASTTLTAGAASPGFQYTLDRWTAYCTGASLTYQRVAGSGDYQYALRFTGASSNSGLYFEQRIESFNAYDLASKTATLKATISSNALTSITWKAFYANSTNAFGTASSPTKTQIDTGTFTINSTDTEYSVQIEMPANAVNGVAIQFSVASLGSGQTLTITGVQLEVGSVASSFERRPYGMELALCQRYFYMHARSNDKTIGRGGYYTSTQVECGIPFPVTMRATPTLFSVTGTSFYAAYRNGGGDDLNSLTLAGETTNTCAAAYNNSQASGTAGHYAHLVIANANAYIGFSAEL